MTTMRCALVSGYGMDPDATVSLNEAWPRPPDPCTGQLRIKVSACSLAPGDIHMLSGRLSIVLHPPSFPYIPGMDVAGVVEKVGPGVKGGFQVGDSVVATGAMMPVGGMAEYMLVKDSYTALKPKGMSYVTAACCPVSATTALEMVRKHAKVKKGERVLVLGGSGGVGSAAVQISKLDGASLVVTTTTQAAMLLKLGADRVINYREADWWKDPELLANKVDVIIDCVGGGGHYGKALSVLKSSWKGGRFVAVVGDEPSPEAKTWPALIGFAVRLLWRSVWTPFCPWLPSYCTPVNSGQGKVIGQVLDLVDSGRLVIPIEAGCPLPFTSEGVREALRKQAGFHAHGKVVVQIAG